MATDNFDLEEFVAFDTETTGLKMWHPPGVSVLTYSSKDCCGNVTISDKTEGLSPENLTRLVKETASYKMPFAHNLKYDLSVLDANGVDISLLDHANCTMLMAHLSNEHEASLQQETLYVRKLGLPVDDADEMDAWLKEHGLTKGEMVKVPPRIRKKYAVGDVHRCLSLGVHYAPIINRRDYKTEMQVLRILIKMEKRGILLDISKVEAIRQKTQRQLARLIRKWGLIDAGPYWKLERELLHEGYSIKRARQKASNKMKKAINDAGGINLGSSAQVGSVLLQEGFALEELHKTETGAISGAGKHMKELARQGSKVAKARIVYMQLGKLLGTYLDQLEDAADCNSVIHTNYNQTVTVTGRLSSDNPNLQNVATDEGPYKGVRELFICRPGHELFFIDYRGLQLRIAAHYARDEIFQDIVSNHDDVHGAVAKMVGLTGKRGRLQAKGVVFGTLFGRTPYGLWKDPSLKLKSLDDAERLRAKVLGFMPGLERKIRELQEEYAACGHIEDDFGRLYRPLELKDLLVNLVQGTEASLVKRAMVKTYPVVTDFGGHTILQIHDEIVFEVPMKGKRLASRRRKIATALGAAMVEDARHLEVPLKVQVKVTQTNWAEAATILQFDSNKGVC